MLILSWNVAAWPTTVGFIGEGPENVASFFEKHYADIVCLQEVKVTVSRIEHSGRKLGASLKNWESFWSPCRDKNSQGFQGVATWAKKGLTLSANCTPFECSKLNMLGRCLRTDHKAFVLFNVYAPCRGTVERVKFYQALRKSMQLAREETKKPVILCGDLNVTLNKFDVPYLWRNIRVDLLLEDRRKCLCGHPKEDKHLLDENGQNSGNNGLCKTTGQKDCCFFKKLLRSEWPKILHCLKFKQAVVETSTSSATGEKRTRYRLRIPLVKLEDKSIQETKSLSWVKIGELQDSSADAMSQFCIDTQDGSVDMETTHRFEEGQERHKHTTSVSNLSELLAAVSKYRLTERDLRILSRNAGEVRTTIPIRQIFQEMLVNDGMVDALRHLHPKMENRYTCWHQYKNQRYENNGSRIDHFLVDKSLLNAFSWKESSDGSQYFRLRCGCDDLHDRNCGSDKYSYKAGLCAATASGRFKSAAFTGGGITGASAKTNESQFGNSPHTGIVYTPPKYSDHVGVSLFLNDNDPSLGGKSELYSCALSNNKATRMAQPHKRQLSIQSFFSGTSKQPLKRRHVDISLKEEKGKKARPDGILKWFGS